MMKRLRRAVLVLAGACVGVTGCVSPRLFREHTSVVAVPPRPGLPSVSRKPEPALSELPLGGPCDGLGRMAAASDNAPDKPLKAIQPCLAFLEFDDMGQPLMIGADGERTQLVRAEKMIDDAKRVDPTHKPVVLVFFHGWKHNAKAGPMEDNNIQGLEEALDRLSTTAYRGHVVVGLYVSWRGATFNSYWPIEQDLSFFDREAAAKRVASGVLPVILREISARVHTPYEPAKSGCRDGSADAPLLFLVGHSFGALVLERAINPVYMQDLNEQKQHPLSVSAGTGGGCKDVLRPLADLVIYVNSAAAASDSKPMMEYFAADHREYPQSAESEDGQPGPGPAMLPSRPLIVSVTTAADSATGPIFKIGHFFSLVQFDLRGSFRDTDPLTCYRPDAPGMKGVSWVTDAYSQTHFWMTTAPHDKVLESHVDADVTPCGTSGDKDAPVVCPLEKSGDQPIRKVGNVCRQVQPIRIPGGAPCNGTPYWMLETDLNVIPDHNTIFTDRLISMLGGFLPESEESKIEKADRLSSVEPNGCPRGNTTPVKPRRSSVTAIPSTLLGFSKKQQAAVPK